jgi:hypothetical protein
VTYVVYLSQIKEDFMSQIKQCIECGKDFEATRSDAVLCSDKCRQAHKRGTVTDKTGEGITDKDVAASHSLMGKKILSGENPAMNRWNEDVTTLGPRDLYVRINLYPGTTWKKSPEYIELMKRLVEMPLETLREQGYFIPTWKEGRESMNKEKE